MILMDKGYYDYDYEKIQKPEKPVDWDSTIKTDEEVHELLSMFGPWANKKKSVEEIQEHIIKQIKED